MWHRPLLHVSYLPIQVLKTSLDRLSRDIKSSQNDQKNAKHYQILSKLVGASGINGFLAPISYFHLQWINPDVDRLSRDTKSEFTITEWPQGRARCAAPSALLLLCFPQKPELATVQWDNQIGDPNFKIRDPLKWSGTFGLVCLPRLLFKLKIGSCNRDKY